MIDMYGEDVARASELIRKHAHTEYYHYFAINMEASLDAFIAMMDSCREEGRQESAGRIAELESQVAALRKSPDVNEAVRAYIQAGKRGLDLYGSMKCAIEAALPSAPTVVEGE